MPAAGPMMLRRLSSIGGGDGDLDNAWAGHFDEEMDIGWLGLLLPTAMVRAASCRGMLWLCTRGCVRMCKRVCVIDVLTFVRALQSAPVVLSLDDLNMLWCAYLPADSSNMEPKNLGLLWKHFAAAFKGRVATIVAEAAAEATSYYNDILATKDITFASYEERIRDYKTFGAKCVAAARVRACVRSCVRECVAGAVCE
jgi:hypothetical protein